MFALPDELWEKIFTGASPHIPTSRTTLDAPDLWYKRHEVLSPLTISHVCRLWRAISLNQPSLWVFIHVDFHTPILSLQAMDVWLARSEPLPLAILCIGALPETHFHQYPKVMRYMTKLFAVRRRWESAWLILDGTRPGASKLERVETETRVGSEEWATILAAQEENLPFLRTFVLRAWITEEYLPHFTGTISSAPHLERLEWKGLPEPFLPLTVHPGAGTWTSLTSIRLEDVDHRSAMGVLSHTSSLERAHLELKDHDLIHETGAPSLEAWQPRIVLRALRRLEVHATIRVVSFIFDGVTVPSMRQLSYKPHGWIVASSETFREVINSMLTRSRCQLECVDLHNAVIPVSLPNQSYFPQSMATTNLMEASLTHFRGAHACRIVEWAKDSLQVLKYVPPQQTLAANTEQSSQLLDRPNRLRLVPNLRELTLGVLLLYSADSTDSLEPLQTIVAPSLSRLTISVTARYLATHPPRVGLDAWSLTDLYNRSRFSLTHFCLEVSNTPFPEDDLISFLGLPNVNLNLQELQLTYDGYESPPGALISHGLMTERVISFLSAETENKTMLNLPSLQVLTVGGDCVGHCGSEPGELARMLRTRLRQGGLRLGRVAFPKWPHIEQEHPDVPYVRQLEEEGLGVVVDTSLSAAEGRVERGGRTRWGDYVEDERW